MSQLTHGDIQDLTAFFLSPLSASMGHDIAAQSYEPRGKAGYDPSTDSKLASMVFGGIRRGKNAWARMKRIIDQLSAPQVEALRLMCFGGREALACRLPRALEAGRTLAIQEQRQRHLESVHEASLRMSSGIAAAALVLEADRKPFAPYPLTATALMFAAGAAIRAGLVDVEADTDALVTAVADAYHLAVSHMSAWHRATQNREDQRRAAFRAELADRQESKKGSRAAKRAAQLLADCVRLRAAS